MPDVSLGTIDSSANAVQQKKMDKIKKDKKNFIWLPPETFGNP